MRQKRRQFLIGLGATPLALSVGLRTVSAQAPAKKAESDFPNAATFRTGDLLWPKRRGAIVPRTRSLAAAPNLERREWEAARQQLLASPAASDLSPEVAERLKALSYEEFERIYFSAQTQPPAGANGTRSLNAVGHIISVGHVALIEVDGSGIPYVVEATPHSADGSRGGVLRVRYVDWLKQFSDVQVWHGRFRDLDRTASQRIAEVALGQLGKPYDFFNFNLNDDRGFYCSKLVWFSVWRAARIAADDNPDPNRGNRFPPWFSPKALIGASRITMLHSPGDY
jgi:cell wall-associated NlpC family hydrolase